jgi:hypothetical protein
MASLLEQLQVREAAARARVEALRAELDRLADQVAAEQALLERLEVTRQTVIELLAGDDGQGAADAGRDDRRASASQQEGPPAIWSATALVAPVFVPDGDVDGRHLPVAYRDVVEVAQAGPLRAAQVCQALGVGGEPRHREGMRVKLKRLVSRLAGRDRTGLFTCASGVADHLAAANGG